MNGKNHAACDKIGAAFPKLHRQKKKTIAALENQGVFTAVKLVGDVPIIGSDEPLIDTSSTSAPTFVPVVVVHIPNYRFYLPRVLT